ncbi:response regulator [Candidatus Uabimicrobium amorphum]|uniref:histidine kinase n=1 Tax=Uabimicrobium amorphum TaxID=2596890 RepID=A0A5S9IQL5_UABAM|nr:response regulator [Candidatus Uabimicrobium amorphum]BBM85846.1 hybrid sensor histidine kinase/responseregulator [Candidatus Uabimicrobium amorphum]
MKKKFDILIVDDKPENLKLLSKILSQKNYLVRPVLNPKQALEIIQRSRPDLILLDINMPEMDGYEVCQYIKSQELTKDIPVIFISALHDREDKIKAFSVGGIDYIPKPFYEEEILARIEVHLNLYEVRKDLELQNQELQKKTKELDESKKQAEQANRTKSQFLVNMSHEIRTPLNAILGFTEILDSIINDSQQKEYLMSIKNSGKSLLSLINDILDLSKVEAGKIEFEYRSSDVASIFKEMQTIFGHKIREKNLLFSISISENLPQILEVDERRLRQVLINLIGNAIKFTATGYIKLLVDYHVTQSQTGDLIFQVQDSGIGIAADQIDSIFNVFEQQKGQNYDKYGGTGLGLAITKRLVENMNGSIAVESTLGEGACFCVTLKDVIVGSELPTNTRQIHQLLFDKATILVVDDIDDNRKLIKAFLKSYDFNIVEARDGEQGFAMAKQHHPDIILMDKRMPILDGEQSTKMIKEELSTQNIPIIALTASAMKNEEEKFKALCDDFLTKPISKKSLVQMLAKFLSHDLRELDNEQEKKQKNSWEEQSPTSAISQTLRDALNIQQQQWQKLRDSLDIDEIQNFGQHIKQLGVDHQNTLLLSWGKTLEEQAKLFDIEKLMTTLNEFPQLITTLGTSLD